ncbi:MAG: cytochrome c biogenesis protein CcsA [Elusimicrobia bacterium]|nr:cytochrome c biogenesis protein CcsA [Elusimicrobiota bacterium]
MSTFLFSLVFGLFLAAFVVSAVGFFFTMKWRFRPGLAALVLGWAALGVLLGLRWKDSGHLPLSNQYESMLFMLWAMQAVFFYFLYRSLDALEWLSPWVSGLSLVCMGVVSLLNSAMEPLVPALQSNWLLIHVTTTMLGYAAFALAFLGGVILLMKNKLKSVGEKEEALDSLLFRSCALGFWLLTLGIITGAVWANSAWGSYWTWDPKETWALITWIFYAIAIHLRRTRGWRNTRFAGLMIAGFVFVVFTYFGVNYLLSGLHSYA